MRKSLGIASASIALLLFAYIPVAQAATCTISANPATIQAGQSATLSWSAQDSGVIPGIGGAVRADAATVSPAQTFTYNFFTSPKDYRTDAPDCSVTVTVIQPTTPSSTTKTPASGSITADSANISIGQSTGIHARFIAGTNDQVICSDITKTAGGGGLIGPCQPFNKDYVFTPTAAGSYTFNAEARTDTYPSVYHVFASVTVSVTAAASSVSVPVNRPCSMQVSPTTITQGQSATLSWSAQDSGVIPGIGGATRSSSASVSPTQTFTYNFFTSPKDYRTDTPDCSARLNVVPPVAVAIPTVTSSSVSPSVSTPASTPTTGTPPSIPTSVSVTSTSVCPNFTRTLSLGLSGDDVTALQNFLLAQGLLSGDSVTGYFGNVTQQAVQQFQTAHDIVSVGTPATTGWGNVGPTTQSMIGSICSGTSIQSRVSFSTSPTTPIAGQPVTIHLQFSPAANDTIVGTTLIMPGGGNSGVPATKINKDVSFVPLQQGTFRFQAKVSTKSAPAYTSVGTYDMKIGAAAAKTPLREISCLGRSASGPVSATHDGQVIENLDISSNGTPGITIHGFSNVRIRNVRIQHAGGIGIDIYNAPNTVVENSDIIDTSGPYRDLASITNRTYNLQCGSSPGLNVQNVRFTNAVHAVALNGCMNPIFRWIEMHNISNFSAANGSDNGSLEDFSVENDLDKVVTGDNINVYNSSNWTISKGLIDGNNSQVLDISGAGLIFDQSVHDSTAQDVDVINQINNCFVAADNNRNITFDRTRCANTSCFARRPDGTTFTTTGAWVGGWGAFLSAKGVRVLASTYAHMCPAGAVTMNEPYPNTLDLVQVTEQNFTPRPAQRVQYCVPSLAYDSHTSELANVLSALESALTTLLAQLK